MRLRVLAALTSSIAFRAAREIGRDDEANINRLVTNQVLPGRRWPSDHAAARLGAAVHDPPPERPFPQSRAVLERSRDRSRRRRLPLCQPLGEPLVGSPESDLHGSGLDGLRPRGRSRACSTPCRPSGVPPEFSFRMLNAAGEWRHLDARVTDLRNDRNLRGVVLNARDTTERVELEQPADSSAAARRLRQPPRRGARDGRRGA